MKNITGNLTIPRVVEMEDIELNEIEKRVLRVLATQSNKTLKSIHRTAFGDKASGIKRPRIRRHMRMPQDPSNLVPVTYSPGEWSTRQALKSLEFKGLVTREYRRPHRTGVARNHYEITEKGKKLYGDMKNE